MNKRLLLASLVSLSLAGSAFAVETQSLAGEWRFAVGRENAALFKTTLPERAPLPGTTQTAGKGADFKLSPEQQKTLDATPDFRSPIMNAWTPAKFILGNVWYQRDIEIPQLWANKAISLMIDRSKITHVWVDDKDCGKCDDICTSHIYDLSATMTPGKHVLSIYVGNGPFPRTVGGHHLGGMQGNWNGMIGRIELAAVEKTHIEGVRVTPDVKNRIAKLRIGVVNPAGGSLVISASAWNTTEPDRVPPKTVPVSGTTVEIDYPLGEKAHLWDEFDPALYRLCVKLGSSTFTTDFGLRDFRRDGTVFVTNGRRTFLRGTHDGGHYPLTGYPPEVEGWLKIFRNAKEYGINHFRFHTFTPNEAAFTAADQVGMYLQPELPNIAGSSYGEFPDKDAYERRMGEAMLRKWANHPSFVMLALGNEIAIKRPEHRYAMTELVSHFRALDPTRLYSEGSNNNFAHPTLNPNDDYWTTDAIPDEKSRDVAIRSSFSGGKGWLNVDSPSTEHDYTKELKYCPVPLIGHEVGQFTFFPDLKERKKYTGVFRLRNYDVIEQRMRSHHVLEQDADFARASGALALICYREEIEAYLRTPDFGGFQLLDLCDNHEQGTSLVGVLDAFWESKGLVESAQWREFCCETVPLLRFPKYTWTTAETFEAKALMAHYGKQALSGAAHWRLIEAGGKEIAGGALPNANVPTGTVTALGVIDVLLSKVPAPGRVSMELTFAGRTNRWPLWIYPAHVPAPQGPAIVRKLDAALTGLARGERVLFIPELKDIESASVKSGFETVFWNFCFANQPPTMGILCDPKHPLFEKFPTDFHSNWQWFAIVSHARAVILDELPANYRPLVQVIDNIATCRKLGLVWEAKVGPGCLLVCSSDLPLHQDQVEVRNFLNSLIAYAGSKAFAPAMSISPEAIARTLTARKGQPTGPMRHDE